VSPDGHGCAISLDTTLHCWGSFYGPRGGHGTWNGTYLQVATGRSLTCAIRGDGTLMCLGETRRLWEGGGKRSPDPETQFSEISAQ
jgi:hypothetical protein